ncbi:unnamed protein product [Arctogadus glacialis]
MGEVKEWGAAAAAQPAPPGPRRYCPSSGAAPAGSKPPCQATTGHHNHMEYGPESNELQDQGSSTDIETMRRCSSSSAALPPSTTTPELVLSDYRRSSDNGYCRTAREYSRATATADHLPC